MSPADPGINAENVLPTNRAAQLRLPELLAPAGDWECAKAAVENGADAIYFGLDRFNARMRAHNFTEASLPRLMEFLHRRGVRGYVTFNTLVFQNEISDAIDYLRSIIAAGVDAAIVQDIGICRIIRELSPDFPIHASTQMTVTSVAGVEFAQALGCNLVVLARECSIREINIIQATLATGTPGDIRTHQPLPLEVFVHGALCVAYSGQCLTSEALGGRSANRGECAQACRMPYDLISDGKMVPLGDRRYLLSPQDLAGLDVLPELVKAGVASLKIEGRLKTPEYVANITRAYRRALDQCAAQSDRNEAVPRRAPNAAPSGDQSGTKYDLEMAFSRGLHTGWFRGINNQALVHGRFGKKRGVYLGEVSRLQGNKVVLTLEAPLKPGDGIVFDAGHPDQPEEGGRVYEVQVRDAGGPTSSNRRPEAVLAFGTGDINFSRIKAGDKLWKTSDPELDRRLRQTFEGDTPRQLRPVTMQVSGKTGSALALTLRDEMGRVVCGTSAMPLADAANQPLTTQRLTEQLGRLGGTPFQLVELNNQLAGEVIIPIRELNRLRREVVEELERLRSQPLRWTLHDRAPLGAVSTTTRNSSSVPNAAELTILVRNLAQLESALRSGATTLYCDFEDPKKYREAVRLAHESSDCTGPRKTIWVAPPRIFKTGEEWTLQQVRSSNADGYLIRNFEHLKFFSDCRRIGDFSLNVANARSAHYFINTFGLEHVTASYDLNGAQLESLLQAAPAGWFEVTIHQHMPMFHMEHCVFCAFLSKGTDYTNCGRPCDSHEVRLRDRVGAEHVLKADAGCRNTVFNARAQTGAEHVNRLVELGVRRFRAEFVNETPEEVARTVGMYRALLRGEISGTQLWRELKLQNQLGVTRGSLERPGSTTSG